MTERLSSRMFPPRVSHRLGKLIRWPSRQLESHIRPRVLSHNVEHISGPERVNYGLDEVIVICVVRNGAPHIRSFIEHHFSLGVRHIVFLDNDSNDDTVKIAGEYSNVTVLRTTCPYRTYENVMKRYLVQRFARNRWSLCVDIDERFDYPFSDCLSLQSLVAYLNKHSYTAMLTQMLDLFADQSVSGIDIGTDGGITEVCKYYDISNIEKTDYPFKDLSNSRIKHYWGGVRRTLFGTRNGLTKAALIFLDGTIEPFVHWHHAKHARIADFAGVLLHYPFAGLFYERVEDAVKTGRYGRFTTREYQKYWQILREYPELSIKRDTARELKSVNELVDVGFLVISESYQRWAELHAKGRDI